MVLDGHDFMGDTILPRANGKSFSGRWSSLCTDPPGRKELGGLGPGIEQNQKEAKPDHGGERERNETPVMQARREREERRPMLACEGGGFRIGEGDTGTNAGWSDGKEERRNTFQWLLFSQLNRRSL